MTDESTPERIISSARRLFNQFGVDRVPVYKIASNIGISAGNVTYHFPRKQDILHRLIDDLEVEASEVLASAHDPSSAARARDLVHLFTLMWRYRFFFVSLTYLTATDPKIAESYRSIRAFAQNSSIQRIEEAVARGDIPAVEPPNSPRTLAENMWAVWINCLGTERRSDKEADRKMVVYDCCLHHLSLIQPYASKAYILRLDAAVRDILGMKVDASVVA